MELDRRDCVVQLDRGVNQKWRNLVDKAKPFSISKRRCGKRINELRRIKEQRE